MCSALQCKTQACATRECIADPCATTMFTLMKREQAPPVIMPPVVKVMVRGARLTMAFAGATTLAAMLVVSVARMRPAGRTNAAVPHACCEDTVHHSVLCSRGSQHITTAAPKQMTCVMRQTLICPAAHRRSAQAPTSPSEQLSKLLSNHGEGFMQDNASLAYQTATRRLPAVVSCGSAAALGPPQARHRSQQWHLSPQGLQHATDNMHRRAAEAIQLRWISGSSSYVTPVDVSLQG
jgi:hypothetical protein